MEIIGKKTDSQQSDLYFPLLNTFSEPLLIKNNYGRILEVNQSALTFLNRSRKNLINKTVFDLFPLDIADQIFYKNEDLLLKRKPIHFEIDIKRNGLKRSWLFKTSLLETREGESLIVERIQDQSSIQEEVNRTDNKQDLTKEDKYKTVFETEAFGIVVANFDKKLVQANNTFAKLIGYTREELIDKNVEELTFEDNLLQINKSIEELESGEKKWINIEKKYRQKNGDLLWANVWGTIIEDSGQKYFLAIVRDLTKEKRINQKLNEKNKELERYIDSNIQLENFAYFASHDLKEPLRTIGNFTQFLERKYKGKFDAEAQECMDFIVDGVKRMNHLVEDLLTYSRVTSIEHNTQQVNISALIEIVQYYLRRGMAENEVMINVYNLPPVIQVNKTQMTQVFQNLISNAVKFRKLETKIQIDIKCKDAGDCWQFSVADNGIGIKPEFHKNIFVLFQKLHTREKYEGTGIGLSLCQKIIEQHGGRIWVESEENKGSTFLFTIPKGTKSY